MNNKMKKLVSAGAALAVILSMAPQTGFAALSTPEFVASDNKLELQEGAVNLALGKKAISKWTAYGRGPEHVVDGSTAYNNTNRFATDDTVSNVGKDIIIDFGEGTTFNQFVFYETNHRISKYKVQYCTDTADITDDMTVEEINAMAWQDTSAGEQTCSDAPKEVNYSSLAHTVDFEPVNARYVRLYVTGAPDGVKGMSLLEVEVYNQTVPADEEIVDADLDTLTAQKITGRADGWTKENLTLPDTGESGSKISWESSKTEVITNDGQVTQQNSDIEVTMTATVEKGTVSKTKPITITVLKTEDETGMEWALAKEYRFETAQTNEAYEVRYNNSAVAELTGDTDGLAFKQTSDTKFADADRPEITVYFDDLIDNRSKYYIEVEYNADMLAGETRVQINNQSNSEAALFSVKPSSNQYLTAAAKEIGGARKWLDNVLKMPNVLQQNQRIGVLYDTYSGQFQFVQNGAIVSDVKYCNSYGAGLGGLWVSFQGAAGGQNSTFLLKNAKIYKYQPAGNEDEEAVDTDLAALTEESIGAAGGSTSENLTLSAAGANGTEISWQSSREDVIAKDGTVTRQDIDTEVILTATVKKGNIEKSKTITVTVLKKEQEPVREWDLMKGITFNSAQTTDDYTVRYDNPQVAALSAGTDGLTITQTTNSDIIDADRPEITVDFSEQIQEGNTYYIELSYQANMLAKGEARMQINNTTNGEAALFVAKVSSTKYLSAAAKKGSARAWLDNDLKMPNVVNEKQSIGLLYDTKNNQFQFVQNGKIVSDTKYANSYGTGLKGAWISFQGKANGQNSTLVLKEAKLYQYNAQAAEDKNAVENDVKLVTLESIGAADGVALNNLQLPLTGANGSVISWSSNRTDVIANDGTVTRPTAEEAAVTLTATFTKGLVSKTAVFHITVPKLDISMTDEEAVKADIASVTLESITGTGDGVVTGDLKTLPKDGINGSAITWSSDNTDAITDDGKVTRSRKEDVTVIMTAVFKKNSYEETHKYTIVVKKLTYPAENLDGLNLALNKSASASDAYNDSFGPQMAVDGDESGTRYASQDSQGNNGKFFMVDFGAPTSFNYVKFKEYNSRVNEYKIQYSNDGVNWADTSIGTQTKSVSESSGHTWTTTPKFNTVNARYVRLLLTKDHPDGRGLSLWEFQVYNGGQYTGDMFEADLAALTLESLLGENKSADAVTTNLAGLPKGLSNGAQVAWTSTDESTITTDGVVYKDAEEDKNVTLTAVITSPKKTMTETVSFDFRVLKKDAREVAVEKDTAAVIAKAKEMGLNQNADITVTNGISLGSITAAAVYGSAVTWKSSNEAIVKNDGTVITSPEEDGKAVLTCTIANGEFIQELTYTVIVPATGHIIEGDLAKNKKVISTGKTQAGCSAEKATDRRYQTKWFTSGNPNDAFIIVDLGEEMNVANVTLMEAPDGEVYTVKTAEILVSSDNKAYTKVADIAGVGEKKDVDFAPCKVRYIKYAVTKKDKGNTGLFEMIIKYAPDAKKVIEADKAAFEWPYGYLISEDIELPEKGIYGSDISWHSSNTSLITNDGNVTINDYDDKNGNKVVMTATFTFGDNGEKVTLPVNIRIKSKYGEKPSGSGGGGRGSSGGSTTGLPAGTGNATHGVDDTNSEVKPSVFRDVASNRWSYPYITKLHEKKIVSGDADNNFNPDQNVTREQLVKMIVEALNIQLISGTVEFDDADPSEWYADYLYTAQSLGIVNGISDKEFGVGKSVTRQDMAAMINRALEITGNKIIAEANIASFTDGEHIDDYAKEGVEALVGAGVINGVDGAFLPKEFATREQCAKVICMVLEKLQ